MHKLHMHEFDWTEDRCAELRERWATGESTTIIGAFLGVSRNAVIGKVHRLGLPKPASKQPVHYPQRAPGISTSAIYRRRAKERWCTWMPKKSSFAKATEDKQPPPPPVENTAFQVTFMDLEPHHCRWISGDVVGLETMFCGDAKQDGSSYCKFHSRKSFAKSVSVEPSIAAARYRRMAKMRAAKKKVAA